MNQFMRIALAAAAGGFIFNFASGILGRVLPPQAQRLLNGNIG